jgi:hypothetical protein
MEAFQPKQTFAKMLSYRRSLVLQAALMTFGRALALVSTI